MCAAAAPATTLISLCAFAHNLDRLTQHSSRQDGATLTIDQNMAVPAGAKAFSLAAAAPAEKTSYEKEREERLQANKRMIEVR